MSVRKDNSETVRVDPDDAPEWTNAMFDHAERAKHGRMIRPATGTVMRETGRRVPLIRKEQ